MTQFNFNARKEQVEKEYNLGKGQYFKVKDGMNKIRLISECLPHESTYKGNKNFKWLCQVIDRVDGKVKPYFMPHSIYCMISDLQLSEDYAFSEVPMPYDISINAQNAGTKEVKYSVTPARNNTPLTDIELEAVKDAPSVQELQKKVYENAEKEGITTKQEAAEQMQEVDPETIPF